MECIPKQILVSVPAWSLPREACNLPVVPPHPAAPHVRHTKTCTDWCQSYVHRIEIDCDCVINYRKPTGSGSDPGRFRTRRWRWTWRLVCSGWTCRLVLWACCWIFGLRRWFSSRTSSRRDCSAPAHSGCTRSALPRSARISLLHSCTSSAQ